MLFLELLKCF